MLAILRGREAFERAAVLFGRGAIQAFILEPGTIGAQGVDAAIVGEDGEPEGAQPRDGKNQKRSKFDERMWMRGITRAVKRPKIPAAEQSPGREREDFGGLLLFVPVGAGAIADQRKTADEGEEFDAVTNAKGFDQVFESVEHSRRLAPAESWCGRMVSLR